MKHIDRCKYICLITFPYLTINSADKLLKINWTKSKQKINQHMVFKSKNKKNKFPYPQSYIYLATCSF